MVARLRYAVRKSWAAVAGIGEVDSIVVGGRGVGPWGVVIL